MTDATITVRGLTKVYGAGETAVHALDGVDFHVGAGEFVVLLGASGSGKTTLLNQIGALEPATAGSITVNGREIGGLDPKQQTMYRRDTVGFVFQFYNLVPTLTALENVVLIAEITGGDAQRRSSDALAAVGLGDRADHFPGQLSGGQQQRVAIARALVKNPPLLLCDEPTGSLDLDAGRQVLALIAQSTGDGRSALVVTHNSEIARMADRVLHMSGGKVVGDEVNPSPARAEDLDW
jgi:putative ABC transport system ATP-binding protein